MPRPHDIFHVIAKAIRQISVWGPLQACIGSAPPDMWCVRRPAPTPKTGLRDVGFLSCLRDCGHVHDGGPSSRVDRGDPADDLSRAWRGTVDGGIDGHGSGRNTVAPGGGNHAGCFAVSGCLADRLAGPAAPTCVAHADAADRAAAGAGFWHRGGGLDPARLASGGGRSGGGDTCTDRCGVGSGRRVEPCGSGSRAPGVDRGKRVERWSGPACGPLFRQYDRGLGGDRGHQLVRLCNRANPAGSCRRGCHRCCRRVHASAGQKTQNYVRTVRRCGRARAGRGRVYWGNADRWQRVHLCIYRRSCLWRSGQGRMCLCL